jgi:hypothetical protein
MIIRLCKSILLFFGRMFETKHRRIEVAILPEVDPMAALEEADELRRMKVWGYGQDYVPKDNDYVITNSRI